MGISVTEAHKKIEGAANVSSNENRVVDTMVEGQVVRQGDVYVHCVNIDHPVGDLRRGKTARQVAVGESTGARHYAVHPAVVYEGKKLPAWVDKFDSNVESALLGPVIDAPCPWILNHPEHANVEFPKGRYQITYQVDPRTQQRRAD